MIEESGKSLTPELMKLMEREKPIERWLENSLDAGASFLLICEDKDYRAAGHRTFEAYCVDRWGLTAGRARQLMLAATTADVVESATTVAVLPQSERQVRPLVPLRDEPEQAAAAWNLAVEAADGGQPTSTQVADAVGWVTDVVEVPAAIKKPDVGGGVSHPARYTSSLMPIFVKLVEDGWRVLDPFAGTGKIHGLRDLINVETVGVEIEPEWAALHEDTQEASALDLPFADGSFDAIVTSPTYGNRMADHHNAADPESRRSYTHDLGHELHEDNSGDLHWGLEYRTFHRKAWQEATRVASRRFVLNIKDHIRGGDLQLVSMWHMAYLLSLGWTYNVDLSIAHGTPSLRSGENSALRVPWEYVLVFDK